MFLSESYVSVKRKLLKSLLCDTCGSLYRTSIFSYIWRTRFVGQSISTALQYFIIKLSHIWPLSNNSSFFKFHLLTWPFYDFYVNQHVKKKNKDPPDFPMYSMFVGILHMWEKQYTVLWLKGSCIKLIKFLCGIVGNVDHRFWSVIALLQCCWIHYGHFINKWSKSIQQNQTYHFFWTKIKVNVRL